VQNPRQGRGHQHQNHQLSPQSIHTQAQIGIDPFNKHVIERVINDLRAAVHEQRMGGGLSGSNNFGSMGGLNGPEGFNEVNHNGNQYGLMNEESTEKWLQEFKIEWERNF
jgi:hypothetical protein